MNRMFELSLMELCEGLATAPSSLDPSRLATVSARHIKQAKAVRSRGRGEKNIKKFLKGKSLHF